MNYGKLARTALTTILVASACSAKTEAQATGCRTGATALADAYVLANPIYSYYFGDLESYVARNREHFHANGDAVRCATALSEALLSESVQLYDPDDQRRRDDLNVRLQLMGVSPGPAQPTPAMQLLGMSMQLSRLARVLPPAANGDYEPLRTPANELEQSLIASGQIFRALMNDPMVAAAMAQTEPLMREAATLEHQAILQVARKLAR